jgi:hypothetical protein
MINYDTLYTNLRAMSRPSKKSCFEAENEEEVAGPIWRERRNIRTHDACMIFEFGDLVFLLVPPVPGRPLCRVYERVSIYGVHGSRR